MSIQHSHLSHVLHIENVEDVKQTTSTLEQVTRHSPRLQRYVCSFVVVRDTFEAFEQMSLKHFDCVIIDESVEFNAYEAIQTIRTLMPEIPILIILPVHNFERALEDSGAAGCTHALESSYTSDQYCTALFNMLNLPQAQIHDIQSITHFPWEMSDAISSDEATVNIHSAPMSDLAIPAHFHGGVATLDSNPEPNPLHMPAPPPNQQFEAHHERSMTQQHQPTMSPGLLHDAMQFFKAQRSANAAVKNGQNNATTLQRGGSEQNEDDTLPGLTIGESHQNVSTLEVEDFPLDSENFRASMMLFNANERKTTV